MCVCPFCKTQKVGCGLNLDKTRHCVSPPIVNNDRRLRPRPQYAVLDPLSVRACDVINDTSELIADVA